MPRRRVVRRRSSAPPRAAVAVATSSLQPAAAAASAPADVLASAVGGDEVAPAGDVEEEEDSAPFSRVLSLGSLCATAAWLQSQNLRTGSGPFDWIHSSPALVRHCLRDDFKSFLDRSRYRRIGQTYVGHAQFSSMQIGGGVGAMWLHHDPLANEEHYALVGRQVERLRSALAEASQGRGRTLLVLVVQVKSAKALSALRAAAGPAVKSPFEAPATLRAPAAWRRQREKPAAETDSSDGEQDNAAGSPRVDGHPCAAASTGDAVARTGRWALAAASEVKGLFHDLLARGVRDFHLDVVYLCQGSASAARGLANPSTRTVLRTNGGAASESGLSSSEPARAAAAAGSERETLLVRELHLVDGHTGLRFKADADEKRFTTMLRGARRFAICRESAGAPELKSMKMTSSASLASHSRYGDDLEFLLDGNGAAAASVRRQRRRPRVSISSRLAGRLSFRGAAAAAAAAASGPHASRKRLGSSAHAAGGGEAGLGAASSRSGATGTGGVSAGGNAEEAGEAEQLAVDSAGAGSSSAGGGSPAASSTAPVRQQKEEEDGIEDASGTEVTPNHRAKRRRWKGPESPRDSEAAAASASASAAGASASGPGSSGDAAAVLAASEEGARVAKVAEPAAGGSGPASDGDLAAALLASKREAEDAARSERLEVELAVRRAQIAEIVAMGFDASAVEGALQQANGDQALALDILLASAC